MKIVLRAVSVRVITASWWLFVLLMISTYTANLAFFLTRESTEKTIDSLEDLAVQNKIKYGMVQDSATSHFLEVRSYVYLIE